MYSTFKYNQWRSFDLTIGVKNRKGCFGAFAHLFLLFLLFCEERKYIHMNILSVKVSSTPDHSLMALKVINVSLTCTAISVEVLQWNRLFIFCLLILLFVLLPYALFSSSRLRRGRVCVVGLSERTSFDINLELRFLIAKYHSKKITTLNLTLKWKPNSHI